MSEFNPNRDVSDILYSYIDRLKDPDPTHDPLDKIVSELIEAFEAAHHD